MQPVALCAGWYVPAEHASHFGRLASPAKKPGKHGLGAALPLKQENPGGHTEHSPSDARLVAFEWLPAGHGRGVAVPSGQKKPGSQSRASNVAAAGHCLPLGHAPAQSRLPCIVASADPKMPA